MITLKDLTEFDPDKKDMAWIHEQVTYMRDTWIPLIDGATVRENLSFLFGCQDMAEVRAMFAHPENAGLKFIPLAMLEKLRNIFTAEVQESGIHVHVCASDPTARNEKERDKDLLGSRKIIETVISHEQKSIGGTDYKMMDDTNPDGTPLFAGNVEEFDDMGLDEDSSEDIAYFFQFYHRLNHEIKAELVINPIFSVNEVTEMLPLFVDDVLAKKAIAVRTYVSDETGAIEHRYIAPEKVYHIPGRRKDGKDALAKGYEEEVTVGEFLAMCGADFNEQTDMPALIAAVNSQVVTSNAGMQYTGITESGCCRYGDESGRCIEFDQLLNVKVKVGYIEFRTVDGTAYRTTPKNYHGNPSFRPMESLEKKVWEKSVYRKEVYYNQKIYKAYYLSTSSYTQYLFKAGPLNWQQTEGADDEYANFSISTFVQNGKTFVEIAKPWVTIYQKAFAKLEFEINRAKPAGRAYFYDSLVAIAQHMFPQEKSRFQAITQVLKYFTESPNEIFTIPNLDGAPVGGGGQSSYALKNGLSETVGEFRATMDWAESMIDNMIGISPQRKAYAPQPREAVQLQQGSTAYSERATSYMPRMIGNCLVSMANRTLLYFQDIINYGTSTIAYKYMLRMMGDMTVADLKTLKNIALHRYGLFVEWYNLMADLEKIRAFTDQALQTKEISPEQAVLITAIRSPKLAAQMLAREKKRNEIRAAKIIQAQNEAQLALEEKKHAQRIQEIDRQGMWGVQQRDAGGRWLYESRKAEAQASVERTENKVDAQTQKIRQETQAEIMKMHVESNLDQQDAAGL